MGVLIDSIQEKYRKVTNHHNGMLESIVLTEKGVEKHLVTNCVEAWVLVNLGSQEVDLLYGKLQSLRILIS